MCNEISAWVMLWEGRVYSTLYVLLAVLPYTATCAPTLVTFTAVQRWSVISTIYIYLYRDSFESLLPSREILLEKLKLIESAKNNCSPNLNYTSCVQGRWQDLQKQKCTSRTLFLEALTITWSRGQTQTHLPHSLHRRAQQKPWVAIIWGFIAEKKWEDCL